MIKLTFAWFVSLVALMGSLYFSEIRGFIPCEYCWYQRILMYPMTFILTMAVMKNDTGIVKYLMIFPILGIPLSLFHYLKQKTLLFAEIGSCSDGVPCSAIYIDWFGFVTIPFLALSAFSILLVMFSLILKSTNKKDL